MMVPTMKQQEPAKNRTAVQSEALMAHDPPITSNPHLKPGLSVGTV